MDALDGRKRTAMYFGDASPLGFLEWYNEIKKNLEADGFDVTHLGFGTSKKKSSRITQRKRTEKRYIDLYKKNPKEAEYWEIYIIDKDEEYLSQRYRFYMSISNTSRFSKLRNCAMVIFDFSIIRKLDLQKYIAITKKYIDWEQEVVFDCSKHDIPLNYGIMQNPKVFDEIKFISKSYKKGNRIRKAFFYKRTYRRNKE